MGWVCLNHGVRPPYQRDAYGLRRKPGALAMTVLGAILLAVPGIRSQGLPAMLPRTTEDPGPNSHAAAMVVAGDAARDAGDVAGAVRGYQRALVWHPYSRELLARLIQVSADEPDSQRLWVHALYSVLADKRGRAKIGAATRKLLPKRDPQLRELAEARARACQELDRLVKSLGRGSKAKLGSEVVAQWVARVGAELMRPAPALWGTYAEPWSEAAGRQSFDPMVIVDQLEAAMHAAQESGDHELAFRIAGVVRGLAVQASDADLLSEEAPNLQGLGGDAARVRAAARAALAESAGAPWTFDRLASLSTEEQAQFTQRHADPANPARVLTPGGHYLVETSSGYETALGASRLADWAHGRLASWFGADPFGDRRGTIRVVSEVSDFDAEGKPHWWAAGFQAGDLTVVRFACGGLEHLSRSITHELMHRFDGVFNAFHTGWLTEGKAVWAGAAYKAVDDAEFLPRHALRAPIFTALREGYDDPESLRELVEGTMEDERDNYTAGYALYLYLESWRDGDQYLFRDRLTSFQKNGRAGGGDPLEFFVSHFADGVDGRPDGFDEFAKGFAEFLRGFGSSSASAWQWSYDAYQTNPPEEYVLDGPTWTWSHRPAEPYLGQDQALVAATVLAEAGQKEAAIGAHLWARQVDRGDAMVRTGELAQLFEDVGSDAEAWCLRPSPEVPEVLVKRLSRSRDFVGKLRAAAAEYRGQGLEVVAGALEADAARLGQLLGLDASPVAVVSGSLHPYDWPRRALGGHGWVEDELLDHDDDRVPGNFYETAAGDLHVGRGQAAKASGLLERAAYTRPVFVRSPEWMAPGRYSIKTTVRLTTAYAEAALIFGHHRRDRYVRVGLQAGDRDYASGRKAHARRLTEVQLQVGSTFEREFGLVGSAVKKRIHVESASAGFELEVLVDGAQAVVRVDGTVRATYHIPNGADIQGHVGFSAAVGAVRFVEPSVQRMDRSAFGGSDLALVRRLGVDSGAKGKVHQFINAPCAAFPRAPQGSLALWIPDEGVEEAREAATRLGQLLTAEHVLQPVYIVLPATASASQREQLSAALGGEFPAAVDVIARSGQSPLDRELWLLFSDGGGVLRVADAFVLAAEQLPRATRRWAKAWASR